jgi:hypothetical protein
MDFYCRVGNDDIANSFIDTISKSSDLLLQFDPPAHAWPFLHNLPIVGHTNKNQRQDGNLQINFASFSSEQWPKDCHTEKQNFSLDKSQYSIEMLQSLGYVFTDKYMKLQSDIQNSFIKIARQSANEFYTLCSSIYKSLSENHCFCPGDIIKSYISNKNKTDSTVIDTTPVDDQFYFIRPITLTPMRVILKPLNREIGNRALRLRGAEKYIRVYIRDENDEILDTLDANIRSRFKLKMFTNGIMCMNKTYYCVGSSTSQMKDASYWFTTLNDGETVDQVRAQFGDFTTIKNMATYVARVGQYFSTSSPTGVSTMGYINYIIYFLI